MKAAFSSAASCSGRHEKGSEILLDDGKVRAVIKEQGKDYLPAEIMAGSKLSNNKGFNIPQ